MRREGRLYVLSAPSGTGKTTLCERLLERTPGLLRSVSVTTRSPRPGEREGKDYFFVSRQQFEHLRRTRGLLEWILYARCFYGTPVAPLREALRKGKKMLLLLDVRGARTLKARFRETITIFLIPPSLVDLKKRLSGRKTEKRGERQRRLRIAEGEMRQAGSYDYVVMNDRLNRALRALKWIVTRDRWGT